MKHVFKSLVFLFLISFQSYAQTPAATIPAFTFYRFDKGLFTNENLQPGKMSFFVFFDSDCDHCQHAVLSINKNYQQFKNVVIYLISLDDQKKMNGFMNDYGPDLKGKRNVTLLQDLKYEFLAKFKPRKYPSMFLFSKDGNLISYEDNEENIFRIIKQIHATDK